MVKDCHHLNPISGTNSFGPGTHLTTNVVAQRSMTNGGVIVNLQHHVSGKIGPGLSYRSSGDGREASKKLPTPAPQKPPYRPPANGLRQRHVLKSI